MEATLDNAIETVDASALRELLDGRHRVVREHTRAILARPEFSKQSDPMPTEDYRELVTEWTRTLAATGGPSLLFPEEFGGLGRVGEAIASFETLALSDLSLLVKCGVQFGLFGGAVHHLGTRKHHERYLQKIATFELPGAFAMSESGHGSNVQNVQTTATYDPESQELVVETPTDEDRKDYIGNAARDGQLAAVFCQLVVGGEKRGIHCVLVPLRDDSGAVVDGVRIEDCGHKLGLNGVDNGRIYFDGIRVPRENLLDRYAQISPEGEYTSPIENENRRFFTMLGTLIQGRISVGGASISATKVGADDRGAPRRCAVASSALRTPTRSCRCMDFRVHQRRLLPALARTYALHFTQAGVVDELGADLRCRRRHRGAGRGGAARTPRTGEPSRRAQGAGDLARDRGDPGVPRGLRRRRLSEREPPRRAARRHRRLHHLRGRQHDPAAARRQGRF